MLKLVSIDGQEEDVLTVDEAKDQCFVTSSDEDTYIYNLIKAAREQAEKFTWRAIIKATYRQYLEVFPYMDEIIELQRPPVREVTSIKYYDPNGTLQTLPEDDYFVDLDSEPARIRIKESWPDVDDDRLNAVQINYTAGYDSSLNDDFYKVPESIKSGMMLLVKHWYDNREPVIVSGGRSSAEVIEVPLTVKTLFSGESVKEFV